ncbi:DgyrCDS14639 [Dimorphilus gyrociliatus]|uniref:DgyrCDS14639 n=1 Tax=Dimorphilus gyrociliatus TaxID=2664684 RepID=A0A7I8WEH8_9ANNE|nr:DgyrCDS14639 [Dimorphilus gyrociliatus]
MPEGAQRNKCTGVGHCEILLRDVYDHFKEAVDRVNILGYIAARKRGRENTGEKASNGLYLIIDIANPKKKKL